MLTTVDKRFLDDSILSSSIVHGNSDEKDKVITFFILSSQLNEKHDEK
jgi:hypothetical protein